MCPASSPAPRRRLRRRGALLPRVPRSAHSGHRNSQDVDVPLRPARYGQAEAARPGPLACRGVRRGRGGLGEGARRPHSKGVDVGREKRAEVRATKARVLAAKNREKQTCAFVVKRYLEEMVELNRKAKGAAEARRMLERAIVPIAAVPARELTKTQARDVIVRVAATARRVAAMTRQELRACWSYASDQGWVDEGVNPFGGKDLGGRFKASARDRALAGAEAGALLRWMHEPGAHTRTVADALELVLRTGLRSGEVCSIRSTELVERAGVLWLEIPAERMKGKRAHSAPLVGRARAIVEARTTDLPGFLFARRQREGDEPRPIEQKVLASTSTHTPGVQKPQRSPASGCARYGIGHRTICAARRGLCSATWDAPLRWARRSSRTCCLGSPACTTARSTRRRKSSGLPSWATIWMRSRRRVTLFQ